MPSPFPGMDPYLETPASWLDFHAPFLTYARTALLESLPDDYDARIDEQVRVVDHSRPPSKRREPVTVSFFIEEEIRERHLEIVHGPDQRPVAVLVLLSPGDKEEPGRSR